MCAEGQTGGKQVYQSQPYLRPDSYFSAASTFQKVRRCGRYSVSAIVLRCLGLLA